MNIDIRRPRKTIVPAAEALQWKTNVGYIFTKKYDGTFVRGGVTVGPNVFICERMVPKDGGMFTVSDRMLFSRCATEYRPKLFYAAHSIAVMDGQDVTGESALARWNCTARMLREPLTAEDGAQIVLADSGNGGEFFQAVVKSGGEGVCAVPAAAPWGHVYAAKPLLEVHARVVGKVIATACLELADKDSGAPLGNCPCRAQFDTVKFGDLVEIHCLERFASGKLREPRFVGVRNERIT